MKNCLPTAGEYRQTVNLLTENMRLKAGISRLKVKTCVDIVTHSNSVLHTRSYIITVMLIDGGGVDLQLALATSYNQSDQFKEAFKTF